MSNQEVPVFTANTIGRPNRRGSVRNMLRYGGPAVLASLALTACGGGPRSGSADNSNSVSGSVSVGNGSGTYQPPKPGPAVLRRGSHHVEVEQFGVDTFTDYAHAYGVGPRIPKGAHVIVDCLATGPLDAAPSAHGNPGEKGAKWYHIEAPPEYAGRFAAANTFENGDTSGPLSSQPAEDPQVPDCP